MTDRTTLARGSSSFRHLLAMAAVIAAGAAVCPTVRADDGGDALKVRTAAQEFDAGRRAYTSRDFPTAADHFENAFRDVPSVEALRLAIRSHEQAGHLARAATLSELALRRYPEDAGTVTLARSILKEAGPKVFKIRIQCEPDCAVVVDERAVFDEAAATLVLYVDPGKHAVAATWKNNRSRAIEVQGEAGTETETVFRAPKRPAEDAVPPPASSAVQVQPGPEPGADQGSGLPPAVTYVGLGLTAALTGATIWSGIDTRNHPGRDAVRDQCIDQGESCPLYQDALSKQKRTNILLGTTIGVAVITSVIGLAYTNWGGDSGKASGASAGVRLQPGMAWQDGPQLGAVGRF